MVQLSHPLMTSGKIIALTFVGKDLVGKVMSLLFRMLSRFVITFRTRSNCLLISCSHHLQWWCSPSLEPKKIKTVIVSTVSPSICHEVMGPDAMIFIFWMLSFKPAFSLSSFTFTLHYSLSSNTFITRLFSSSLLSAIRVVSSAYLRLLIFLPAILIPACASSSPGFCMMYSAWKLNKQGDNIKPWRTPFNVSNKLLFHLAVTAAFWPACRFLRRQVRWTGIPIS